MNDSFLYCMNINTVILRPLLVMIIKPFYKILYFYKSILSLVIDAYVIRQFNNLNNKLAFLFLRASIKKF